jgi:hypothetical protein
MSPVRKLEAFIGEHASGKSEVAINRALELKKRSAKVTIVDLDLVDPFFTIRAVKDRLEERGVCAVGISHENAFGLGEAGTPFTEEMQGIMGSRGDIVFDIGYGVFGAKALNLIEGALSDPNLKIFCVVNACRPMTSTLERIVKYTHSLGRVDGLINNTHLGDETTPDTILGGAVLISDAARILEIPMIATAAQSQLAKRIGQNDIMGNPIWPLERFMHDAYW